MSEKNIKKKAQLIRKKLRLKGILPVYGEFLNEEQKIIWNQLNKGDFSYWETFRREEDKIKKLTDSNKTPCKCVKCGEEDPINFYPRRKNTCKSCELERLKIKYRNGDLADNLETNKIWRKKNFIRVKVLNSKHRAIRKGFEFELTEEIIKDKLEKQKGKCYFTNIELTFNSHDWHSMSFDRLDVNVGYTNENTVLVTRFVNIAKSTMTGNEFIDEMVLCYSGITGNIL
jgi:hypothetical protein